MILGKTKNYAVTAPINNFSFKLFESALYE